MGPNPNGPRSVSCDRAIRYSGLGVCSVGPVGDFLETIHLVGDMLVSWRATSTTFRKNNRRHRNAVTLFLPDRSPEAS